jgi:hypothetical protein
MASRVRVFGADGRLIASSNVPASAGGRASLAGVPRGQNVTASVAASGPGGALGAAAASGPLAVPPAGADCGGGGGAGCVLLAAPLAQYASSTVASSALLHLYNTRGALPPRLSAQAYVAAAKTKCASLC